MSSSLNRDTSPGPSEKRLVEIAQKEKYLQNQKFNLHLGIIKILLAARGIEGPTQSKTMEMWVYFGVYISVTFLWSSGTCSHGLGCILHHPSRSGSWEPSLYPSTLGKGGEVPNPGLNLGLNWAKTSCQAPSEAPSLRQLEAAAVGQMSYTRTIGGSLNPTGKLCWASLGQPECIILLPAQSWCPSDWEKTLGKAAGPHFPANPHLQAQTWDSPGSPWAPAKSKFSSAQA